MITNAYKYANGDTKSTIDIAIFIIPINTPHALPTLTPVSYTHLDVYKRQLLSLSILSPKIIRVVYVCAEYADIKYYLIIPYL